MSVKLSTRQVGDVSVVDVAGRITLGEGSSALRDLLREMVGKGQKKILLNLGDVSYIDSSGIGELVSGFTTVTNHGGQLKLVGLTKRVKDLRTWDKICEVPGKKPYIVNGLLHKIDLKQPPTGLIVHGRNSTFGQPFNTASGNKKEIGSNILRYMKDHGII